MKKTTINKNAITFTASIIIGVLFAFMASYVMVNILGGDSGSILPSVVR